ncbi:MAG: hypothetical protein FWC47_13095 [Oscillospiraceae bacterium]|nr:hypothetical protein [Oscillospiraceae bacterium]
MSLLSYENGELKELYKGLEFISVDAYFQGLLPWEDKLSVIGKENGKVKRIIIENNECTVQDLSSFIPEISIGVSYMWDAFNENIGVPYHELTLKDGRLILLEANGMNYVVSSGHSDTVKSQGILGDRIYGDKIGTIIVTGYSPDKYHQNQAVYLFKGQMRNAIGDIYADGSDSSFKLLLPNEKIIEAAIWGTVENMTLVFLKVSTGNELVCFDNANGEMYFKLTDKDLPKLLNLNSDLRHFESGQVNFALEKGSFFLSFKNYQNSYFGKYYFSSKTADEVLIGDNQSVVDYTLVGKIVNIASIFIIAIVVIACMILIFHSTKNRL